MESNQTGSGIVPKHLFERRVETTGILVPQDRIKSILLAHPAAFLTLPKTSNVVASTKPLHKLLLLSPSIPIPESLQDYEKVPHTVNLTYSSYSYHEVLQELLPKELTIPTGFETIGHIAHFNLNPSQLPYQAIIGQVLLDVNSKQKNPNIKTVVNKLSKIENVFRTFPMEIIAGIDKYETEVVRNK